MPLLLLVLLVPIIFIALLPFMLIQRYRAGKARRLARPWVATLNLAVMTFSAVCFLVSAAFTTIWIPKAFTDSAMGLAAGLVLGTLALAITRWEATPRTLHYTPNRWLVLLVTLLVTARILYGLFRSLAMAQSGLNGGDLVMAFGVPESLAAGATVIGYYLAYNAGLRWRIRRWQRRALRPMSG
ncbi:MAG TPA: hypothetical protein VM096_14930 [Vicinamibacterales bacterium]|nr:hypothetical protein [Vicinamibacterales bacterium]